jgi:hypothetical protein
MVYSANILDPCTGVGGEVRLAFIIKKLSIFLMAEKKIVPFSVNCVKVWETVHG